MSDAAVIPPDALLHHAGFVQRLAAGLVRDPGLRDDVVQETWLAATRHPPRAGRPVRGWLATVLRNAVRRAGRTESRRVRREEAAVRPEAQPTTLDRVAREEMLRRIVAAVFSLDADRREVVLLRFYEGLLPREIAQRLGVSVNTVKSRLRRALAVLRRDLGREDRAWRAGLIGAFGLERVLPASGAGTTGSTVGVLVMGTKVKVAVAVGVACLLGGGGWWAFSASEPEDPASEAARLEAMLDETDGPALEVRGREGEHAGGGAMRGAAPAAGASGGTQGGKPAPADADPAAASRSLEPDGPDQASLKARGALDLLPPGVIGGVVFRGTEPFSEGEAVVWTSERGGGPESIPVGREPLATTALRRDGSYRFGDLEPGRYYLGVKVAGKPLRMALRELTVGSEKTPQALTVLGTASLVGRVYDESGRPVPDVSVRVSISTIGPTSNWTALLADEDGIATGAYTFDELPQGGGWLSVSYTNDFDDMNASRSRRVNVTRGETTRANFGSPGGTPEVSGRILAACGEPLRGPGGLVFSDKHSSQYVESQFDAEGRYTHRLPPSEYTVVVSPAQRGHDPHRPLRVALTVGERDQTSDLTIPGTRVRGTVRAFRRGDRVAFRRIDPPGVLGSTAVHADGTWILDGLTPGTWTLHVGPRAKDEVFERHRVTIREGDTLRVLDLPGR